MAEPSDNVRRALRGHLRHLLDLIDKVHEICGAGGSSSVRFNYPHCLDGERRDDIVRSLEDFRQEVNQAVAHWGIVEVGTWSGRQCLIVGPSSADSVEKLCSSLTALGA